MITSRELGGAHLITDVGYADSWWRALELKIGLPLSPAQRAGLQSAMDSPVVVDWNAEPIRFEQGARFSPLSNYGYFGGVVDDPAAFTRMNLA